MAASEIGTTAQGANSPESGQGATTVPAKSDSGSPTPAGSMLLKDAAHAPPHQAVAGGKAPEDGPASGMLAKAWAAVIQGPKATWFDPENPPEFTLSLNILFTAAAAITVGNLYYNQPVLNMMAHTFGVSFERASSVATLMQAGYAGGLLFLCPLGDFFKRRPFILGLIALTAILWLALCLTTSFAVFQAVSFMCGFTTVTPQLMLPLVSELAPPHRRASALSIVVAGFSSGVMLARVLSGIVANYTHWRNVYWVSFALQHALLAALYLGMPDYPSKSAARFSYPRMLWSIFVMLATEPALVQAGLAAFCMSAVFTSYWTTLSFLLSSPPYGFGPLEIGLFGLIGLFVIFWGPPFGRIVLDRLTPLVPALGGLVLNLVGVTIGTFTGTSTVAGPIVQALLNDVSMQATNICLRVHVYGIDPAARNRINTAYMLASFCGQLTGTAVGNRLYALGGWTYSGSCSMALTGFAILICLARGPREKGWVGWAGGWNPRADKPSPAPAEQQQAADVEQQLEDKVVAGPERPQTGPERGEEGGKGLLRGLECWHRPSIYVTRQKI
ncbi:hypothetical protein RB594_009478 [Gaeumannomyces avenae]